MKRVNTKRRRRLDCCLLYLSFIHLFPIIISSASHIKYGSPVCGNEIYPSITENYISASLSNFNGNEDFLRRIKNEPVVIKLNVVYDPALEVAFSDYKQLEKFIKNLIYQTQLIYEQPEMREFIKIQLVIVSIQKLQITTPHPASSSQILNIFSKSPEILNSNADLNILLNYRSYYDFTLGPGKILGLAYTGSFCKHSLKSLVFIAQSYGTASVLAHEIAHALGVPHDGVTYDEIAKPCNSPTYIMYPAIGGSEWSSCSITALRIHLLSSAECVYDSKRLANAIPISQYFDLSAENRTGLPGKEISLNEQCNVAFNSEAYSDYSKFKQNALNRETCEVLTCSLKDERLQITVGRALSGSECSTLDSNSQSGTCHNGRCMVS